MFAHELLELQEYRMRANSPQIALSCGFRFPMGQPYDDSSVRLAYDPGTWEDTPEPDLRLLSVKVA